MSVIDKLNNIINCKNAIREAINNKGGILTESSKLRDYATAIDNLTAGGGSENRGGLIKVHSLPDNKYDTTSIHTMPHKVNDILINAQVKGAANEAILLSQLAVELRAHLIGGEVVDSLPTENIVETTQASGVYFYYSTSNNEAYLHSTEIFGGWKPLSEWFCTLFEGILMPCQGLINSKLNGVVSENGYYIVNADDYYKYFNIWEEITYSGDGSDVIDSGFDLPEKDIDKDKVYKVKYFDDIYAVLEEGKAGIYLSDTFIHICGVEVCDELPTNNIIYPPEGSDGRFQHVYYVKNKDVYAYVSEAKKFESYSESFSNMTGTIIPFKGEVDEDNNSNNTTLGTYAAYRYRYYRSTSQAEKLKHNSQELNVIPSTENQEFETTGNNYYSRVTVEPVTSTIDTNIVPENIAKNVTILGVTGTFEGGASTFKKYLDYKKTMSNIFENDSNITFDELNEILSYDDTSNVTDMSYMFSYCSSLTSIPQINTISATNMNGMFQSCSSLTTIPLLDTVSVTSMNSMFHNCSNLTSIPLLNTSNVTNMERMFYGCSNLTSVPQLNTSNNTSMRMMLYECSSLTSIPELNTSKVTDMYRTFYNCSSLTSIPELNTSKVTDMNCMFYNCSSLTTIPLLDTSNITDMSQMFQSCSSLTSIPQLNTSNVTDMGYMFGGCSSLTTVPLLNTISVTDMSSMFRDCTNLTTIPQLNTNNVTDMSYMFKGCSSLTSIPQLDTNKVTYMNGMFKGCSSLTKVDLTDMKTTSTYYSDEMLVNCYLLTKLIIRNMPSAPSLNSNSFTNCYHFTGQTNSTYNPNGLKDGRIYVPDSMVNTLKSATNWSKYADIIVPLSTLEE